MDDLNARTGSRWGPVGLRLRVRAEESYLSVRSFARGRLERGDGWSRESRAARSSQLVASTHSALKSLSPDAVSQSRVWSCSNAHGPSSIDSYAAGSSLSCCFSLVLPRSRSAHSVRAEAELARASARRVGLPQPRGKTRL